MGVCYFVVCNTCKKYIDIHKRSYFTDVIGETQHGDHRHEAWGDKALKFTWDHRSHEIELRSDQGDWYSNEPFLTEVKYEKI